MKLGVEARTIFFQRHECRRALTTSSSPSAALSAAQWSSIARGGRAELLSSFNSLKTRTFVDECRDEFVTKGWCHIPNFLSAQTCATMCAEASSMLDRAGEHFESTDTHTVYQEEKDESLGPDHVRNRDMKSSKKIVDFARCPELSPLKQLYARAELVQLVQQVVGIPELHRSACPFNAAYYNGYYEGDQLGWHFDRSEFGVNLVLQEPSAGGVFDYHHLTRSEEDPWAFGRVSRILEGKEKVETPPGVGAGSLVFFAGRLSLHRVSPVEGPVPRINAILTYEKEAGRTANAYSLKKFFGRGKSDF